MTPVIPAGWNLPDTGVVCDDAETTVIERVGLYLQGHKGCYVVPSYSGGSSDATVDGALRRPQCFGARREPWAQLGAAHCAAELDDLPDVLEHQLQSGWVLRPATA